MDKIKQVKVIGNVIGFNMYGSKKETYNVQFPDMTIAELESYQFEEADAYHTNDRPRYLRNVLARLRELPGHDRNIWLKGIMGEFKKDFSHVKWCDGYEQGKFDGAVEAGKSNKVFLTKEEADYLGTFDLLSKQGVRKALYFISRSGWGYSLQNGYGDRNEGLLAKITHDEDDENSTRTKLIKAVLFGYDVEPEKRYAVMLCNGQSLKKVYRQGDDYLDFKMGYDNFDNFTKQQLEDAGFGWVFDCEGVEVQEVQGVEVQEVE